MCRGVVEAWGRVWCLAPRVATGLAERPWGWAGCVARWHRAVVAGMGAQGGKTRHKAVAAWGRGSAYVSVHGEELGRCRCRGRQQRGEGVRGQRAPVPAALTQAQTCWGRQAWAWGAEPDRHAWPPHGLAVPLRGAPSTRLDVEVVLEVPKGLL